MKDFYKILEISETASLEEIKKAYRELVRQYHPDVLPPDTPHRVKKMAEEKFKEVQEAYEILSDPEKKKKYDQELRKVKASQTSQQGSSDNSPLLRIDKNYFNFDNLKPFGFVSDILTIFNEGGGVLSGNIVADKPWVKLSETIINASDYQEIEIGIDTASLSPGFSDSALIEIETDGGEETVSIDVSVELSFIHPVFDYLKSLWEFSWVRVLATVIVFALWIHFFVSLTHRSPVFNEAVEPKTIVQVPVEERPLVSRPIPRVEIPKLEEVKPAKVIGEPSVNPCGCGNESNSIVVYPVPEPTYRYEEPDRVIVYSEPEPVYRYEGRSGRIVFTPNPQIIYTDDSFYASPEMQFQNNAQGNDFLVPLIINLLLESASRQRFQEDNRHDGGHGHR